MEPDLFSRSAMESLCAEIDLPEAFRDALLPLLPRLRAEVSREEVLAQCDPARAQATTEALRARFEACNHGLAMLALALCAAENTARIYAEQGIARAVFLDTMRCFSRFARECALAGDLGYDRAFWTWRQLSGQLFRLGTLEFERCVLSAAQARQYHLLGGAPVLSVHIPSDAVCSGALLHASYRQAREFFARQFGERPPIVCRTWLLASPLETLLPERSGIRTFRQDYSFCMDFPEAEDYRIWLYGRAAAGLPDAALPEETSLQRRVKAHLLAGGSVGEGTGRLREEAAGLACESAR